jgi:hypothetical protein
MHTPIQNSRLVKIYQTSSEIDAILMKDVLENYGFQVWIQNLEISKILGSGNLSFGSFFLTGYLSIFVLERDYKEAYSVVGFHSVRERKVEIEYEKLNLETNYYWSKAQILILNFLSFMGLGNLLSILFSINIFTRSKLFSLINLVLSLILLFGIGCYIYFSKELNLYSIIGYFCLPFFVLMLICLIATPFRFENNFFGRGLLLLSILLFIMSVAAIRIFDLFDLFSHRYPLPEK